MLSLLILALLGLSTSNPIATRCFHGGQLIAESKSATSISEFCLKDDVSMLKSEVIYTKNDTGLFGHNKVFRSWTIKDWKLCNPIPTAGGTINVIEVNKDLSLMTKTYICSRDCTITIDKEEAQIIFQTDKLNHFEVSGTTLSSGWFKSKASVTLDRTCEHVKVTCGKKSLQFHACFKHHMSCVRFFHNTILPGNMITSMCQNIELIIILGLTLAIFILMVMITKTYICYLLMPIFMPIAYLYGWAYNKSCKKCNCCGLAYHPFTNCGSHCVCGLKFEASDRMRIHRESGLCQGYKSLRIARLLCKSKGSSLVISGLLSMLILSFVTPIEGTITNYPDSRKYTLEEITDVVEGLISEQNIKEYIVFYTSLFGSLILLLAFIMSITLSKITSILARRNVIYCEECSMYHSKRGIKYNGDFTNKCGFCTCNEQEDAEGVVIHKVSKRCTYKYQLKWAKVLMITLVLLLIAQNTILIVAAETDCWAKKSLDINCIGPMLNIGSCTNKNTRSYDTEAQKLVSQSKVSQLDADQASLLGSSIDSAIKAIRAQKTYPAMHLLETIFLMKNCDYYTSFNHNSGYSQAKWRLIAKTGHFDICSRHSTHHFCRCINDGTKCQNGDWDFAGEMNETYNSKNDFYLHDLNLFYTIFENAFPGTTESLFYQLIQKRNTIGASKVLGKLITKYGDNNMFVGVWKFGQYLLTLPYINNTELSQNRRQTILAAQELSSRSHPGRQESMSSAIQGSVTKECHNAKDVGCISPRFGIPIGNLTACGDSPNYKIYKTPEKLYKSNNKGEVWCSNDVHCLNDFEPADEEVVNKVKKLTCFLTDVSVKTDIFSVAASTCKMADKGVCTVNDAKWNIIKCDSGLYYFTDHREGQDTGNDFGEYCISHSCNTERFPINPDILKDCTWEFHSRKSKYISTISLESLEEFRRAMTEKLSHTLTIYNFKPTANLPHIRPTYKFITANGVENSDGIESAYILSSIPALGGISVGYNVQTKDNFPLLDIIVFVKSAVIRTTYNHIYDTGPTIGINTQHDEHCTGPCPAVVPHKENWITFSQERTSRWGCEEFGCLAINTGCVFGSCQDIIHPETKVYRKAVEEEVVLTVCINFPGNNYCTEINAIEPKITDEIELQFKTVDTKTLPNLLAVQNHKLYSGQINDLGSFSQGCGNVQKTNHSILGMGTAKFDYVCHGASRKDVIVRRCYNNNFDSCKLLKEETSLVFADNHETLEVAHTKHLIGELQFKIMLGDIRYKSFAESPELEIDAKCVGCPSCFESYSCNFQIVTNIDTVCSVEGPCTLFHNRIIISASKQSYGLKMSCQTKPSQNEEFIICNRKYSVLFTTIDKNDKIEVNTGDQTSYIYEKDSRCKTWLCKVRDEGISVLFEPLKAFFGSYFSIIFYVVVGIIVLFLVIYIFLPMFFKLKDVLKKNEYLYLQELKHR
ncbi:glycoprotein precursor [Fort Sherman virus]|uniref:Envelopment polyprotein n=2 Tax=Fort Sherman virus TaxID=273345 RepID=A0A240FC76_9VIRU|nr:glycoprotein precursor [Fort Sherman virus]ARI46657.1 glycoprotein precursor [Fort Sherman virus]AXP32015.1 glycoprotein precursor [Fort Sherman virus]